MKNDFSFDKLFKQGINFQRLSDSDKVKEKIEKTYDCGSHYNSRPSHTSFCSRSRATVDHYLHKTKNFVNYCYANPDQIPTTEFIIDSYAIRRKLSQEINHIYRDSDVLRPQFGRRNNNFTIRGIIERQPGFEAKEVKLDE